jgi:hypothetical protein
MKDYVDTGDTALNLERHAALKHERFVCVLFSFIYLFDSLPTRKCLIVCQL